ncbi:MAG TPA: N-acetylneuraminate synthase [Acidiferrobacteraceae bacterium]|nr:N-acetylneuraminate synthase [Acidiferrobacteraceae bacterium]
MKREMIVDGVSINDDSECWVIAEIGHNHQGDVEQCKELFKVAKASGANAVKLQKRNNSSLFTREMYKSRYNSYNAFGETYGEHREFLEFGREQYLELQEYAQDLGITFFATPFDVQSADFLESLDMPIYKIASGDLTNTPLIKHVASFGKPLIMSTGGGTMDEVCRAYRVARDHTDQVAILQCTAGYPPSWEEVNLRVISAFRDEFDDATVGLSSHDSGIAMGLAAFILGARIIEKHFTLNRAMKGTDHAFSLEHSGMEKLVRDLRRARVALGDGVKRKYASEEKPLYKMAKKLVVARDLPEGHVLSESDLAIRSPNDGLPPYEIYNIVGKQLNRNMAEEEAVSFTDLSDV